VIAQTLKPCGAVHVCDVDRTALRAHLPEAITHSTMALGRWPPASRRRAPVRGRAAPILGGLDVLVTTAASRADAKVEDIRPETGTVCWPGPERHVPTAAQGMRHQGLPAAAAC